MSLILTNVCACAMRIGVRPAPCSTCNDTRTADTAIISCDGCGRRALLAVENIGSRAAADARARVATAGWSSSTGDHDSCPVCLNERTTTINPQAAE